MLEANDRSNDADLATTSVYEDAQTRHHFDVEVADECAKREVETGAVAYVLGRYFGHFRFYRICHRPFLSH